MWRLFVNYVMLNFIKASVKLKIEIRGNFFQKFKEKFQIVGHWGTKFVVKIGDTDQSFT